MYDKNWSGHDLVYSTLGVPKEAMDILGYIPDVLIDDFKDSNGLIIHNTGRTVDVKDSDIAAWTTLHEKGKYNDKIHCPPTFVSSLNVKKLTTGTCKTKGADGADGITTIGAVEIVFKDYDGITAAEWEEIARSNENRPLNERDDFIKNDRKNQDILSTLKIMYNKGNMKLSVKGKNGEDIPSNTDLNKRLERLKLPKGKWNDWRTTFYREIGVNKNLIVRSVATNKNGKDLFKNEVRKMYPGKKIYFKELVSGTSHSNTKYGIELTRDILDARLNGNPYDYVVFKITEVSSPKTLNKNRENNRDFFTDENGTFQQDLKRTESKINPLEKWPEVLYEPQTEQEITKWKNGEVKQLW